MNYSLEGGRMSSAVVPMKKKTPYDTALDLKAIFTEFPPGRTERGQILVRAFGGKSQSSEPKLVWMCADFKLTREALFELVHELAERGYLDPFYDDPAAKELLSYCVIEKACERYVHDVVTRRARSEAEQNRCDKQFLQLPAQMKKLR